jgi:Do/DeqQ family serine protease
MKNWLKTLGTAAVGGAMVLGTYKLIETEEQQDDRPSFEITESLPQVNANYTAGALPVNAIDFTEAANKTVNSVVHVFNKSVTTGYRSQLEYFMGRPSQREAIGTGSGVIITADGYIVTNNHVIENSTELRVKLNNNKTYVAELVGTEPSSDIALLKIDTDEELPYVVFGDSDQAQIGEWVLAVGNPFNLTSTVTAGIISAKGRDLNTSDRNMQNFIQTDAAVNPGNSGGALINTNGELIGINTAIASRTGSYVGYSFAVPSNNARKIIQDLMEYGSVQKGMLGISGRELNGSLARKEGLPVSEGIYIADVVPESGASKARVREGDIITGIDGLNIRSFNDLTGYVASKNPGDIVNIKVLRDDRILTLPIEITLDTTMEIPELEMMVRNMNSADRKTFKSNNGVKVVAPTGDLRRSRTDWRKYIITKVNDKAVNDVEDLKKVLEEESRYGDMIVEMKNDEGETERYRVR